MGKGTILLVSRDVDPTCDNLVKELENREASFVRVHPRDFPRALSLNLEYGEDGYSGVIAQRTSRVELGEIRSVWYRSTEGPALFPGFSADEKRFARVEIRETLRGLWSVIPAFWVNDPLKNLRGCQKLLQLALAQKLGLRIPKTLITTDSARVKRLHEECRGKVIFKGNAQTVWTDSVGSVFTSPVSKEQLESSGGLLERCPGMFQECIDKRLELRVTVIGRKVFTVALYSQEVEAARYDWRKATEQVRHEKFDLPHDIESRVLKMMDELGLNYGALDMIVTPEGEYVFLEINPQGQFGWIEVRTGMPLYSEMANLLIAGKLQ